MTAEILNNLRAQISALTESERAALAHELIMSLDGPRDNSVEQAWNEEITRRVAKVKSGQAMRQSMDPKAKDKLYAFHAPEVACIRKGKARNPNEYFVLACHALPGNPYDGHTLYGSLIKTTANTGVIPRSVLVDRGYKSAERSSESFFLP